MATKKSSTRPVNSNVASDDVDAYMRELDHPLKREIESLRKLILGVSPEIQEGIKWNSPSFRTSGYFATLNLGPKRDRIMLILHTGAKRQDMKVQGTIADPSGLIKWLAKDRGLIEFIDANDVKK